jgi:hypothetical protein
MAYAKGERWTREMHIERDLCQASVVNLITLG